LIDCSDTDELMLLIDNKPKHISHPYTATLNFNYKQLTKWKLFIYDKTGKLVHSEIIKNTNSTTVSTSTFNKCIYFYKIVDAKTDLSLDSGKVVK